MKLMFTVPGPPVPKARARLVRKGGRVRSFTPDRTTEYEHRMMAYATQAKAKAGCSWPLEGTFRLHVDVYRAVQRGDADNFLKAAGDGLNGVLWLDDRMVHDARVRLYLDRKNPRTVVTVWALGEAE